MPDYKISKAGPNGAGLVSGLKFLLNAANTNPRDPLTVNETLDQTTLTRASAISTLYNYGDSLNTVSTRTLVNLTKKFQTTLVGDPSLMAVLPDWMARLARAAAGTGLSAANFKADQFLAMYKENFSEYMPSGSGWEDNFRRFVNFIFADSRITDRRWAAYLMATAMHEGRAAADKWKATWNPVSETGGDGKTYGQLETVTDWDHVPLGADGNRLVPVTDAGEIKSLRGKLITVHEAAQRKDFFYPKIASIQRRYYGRGYVQITFQANYRAMDEALNLHNQLLADPELAVRDAQVSYNISSYGICRGSFSGNKKHIAGQGYVGGYKIADYVNESKTDYFNAREIVNGDKNTVAKGGTKSNGQLVAGYCETFQAMFDASLS